MHEILSDLPIEARKKGYVAFAIQKLIDNGYVVEGMEIQRRFWADIDYVEDINEVRANLLSRPLEIIT